MSHATGLKASLQRQDAGSIPGPAQWVKGSNCGSDLIPGLGTLYGTGQPKKKKKERKKILEETQKATLRKRPVCLPVSMFLGGCLQGEGITLVDAVTL